MTWNYNRLAFGVFKALPRWKYNREAQVKEVDGKLDGIMLHTAMTKYSNNLRDGNILQLTQLGI